MNKIIVVVANNNECIESLKKAGDSIGVEIKSEIQSEGKIINELSVNDIKGEWACLSYFNFIGNKMKGEY